MKKRTTERLAIPDIAGIRGALGLTPGELAAQLDVDGKTVERWESGLARPSRMTIINIGDLLARGLATCGR